MTEKRWTQSEVDSIIAEDLALEGTPEEVAKGRAKIEAKWGLSPGALSKPNASTATLAESEKAKIYPEHYEATPEEVDAMTMEQYKTWSDLGGHLKKTAEEIRLDEEAEERDRAQAEENELTEKMTMEEYKTYMEEKAEAKRKAEEQEAAEVARVAKEEQEKAARELGYKDPSMMTMLEYVTWRNNQNRR
jgi:hypothetical protein